jgi:hypothetical protein
MADPQAFNSGLLQDLLVYPSIFLILANTGIEVIESSILDPNKMIPISYVAEIFIIL